MFPRVKGLSTAVAQVRAISRTTDAIDKVAELDLGQVTRGRYDFDAAGHYSRPDLFTLSVDMGERHPVEWRAAESAESPDAVGDGR
jgi:hypothetical protein